MMSVEKSEAVSEATFLAFAANVLKVPAERLSLETTFGSLEAWDSIAQLSLVTACGERFGLDIPFADVTSVTSLWEFFRRLNGLPVKKVVAVDLDGTLWRGVIGEDGLYEIRPDIPFQRRLKALAARGVILVALSKNCTEDALAGLAHPNGILRIEDFAATRFNWYAKANNLTDVAAELNLATDAFVFVDDNPAERLEMASCHPEVTVAHFPAVVEAYFPETTVTDEDRARTEQYHAEAERRRFLAGAAIPDLWQALGIHLDVHPLAIDETARVAQLSQKANQFNLRTHRYAERDIAALAADPAFALFTAHTGDRFGEQGLVAYVIVDLARTELVDFTMSCRVAGRRIEEHFWTEVERQLRTRGISRLAATWERTARNEPVADLLDRLGFRLVSTTPSSKSYERILR